MRSPEVQFAPKPEVAESDHQPDPPVDATELEDLYEAPAYGEETPEPPTEVMPGDTPEENFEGHLYESKLVEKLDNPELAGTLKFKSNVDSLAVKTVNNVEKIAHTGQDFISNVKRGRLKAQHAKNIRKSEKYERKANDAASGLSRLLVGDRLRKHYAKKSAMYGRVAGRKKLAIQNHESGVEQRHEKRKGVFKSRSELLDERREILLTRAQLATYRKIQRRANRLERTGRFIKDERTKELLQKRKEILARPTIFGKLLAEVDAERNKKEAKS